MVATIVLPKNTKSLAPVVASPLNNACPDCGADAPVITPEGFTVCSACGVEYPESQPYVCSDALARGGGVVQSHMILAPHTRRTIGTRGEQATLPRALAWGDKISVTYEQEVFMRGYFEIRKALAQLDLEGRDGLFDASMAGFARAYRGTPKGGRCHNVHLLALVATFQALRAAHIPVPRKEFLATCLDHSRFPGQVFNAVLKDTAGIFPSLDRGAMVPHEVSAILSRLAFPKDLAEIAAKITRHHASVFQSPKPAVAAAAIVGVTVIAAGARDRYTLSVIAKHAGIAASAMIRCMSEACRRRKHPVEGSIVHAADYLRAIFIPPTEASPEVTNPIPLTSNPTPVPKITLPIRRGSGKDDVANNAMPAPAPTRNTPRDPAKQHLSTRITYRIPAVFSGGAEGGEPAALDTPLKNAASYKVPHLPFPEGPPEGFPH